MLKLSSVIPHPSSFDPARRIRVAEQMDADDVDPRDLAAALRFIRRINLLLGYNRSVVTALRREIERLKDDRRPITVLDVAAGSGDLLVQLGRATSRPLERFAIDRHAATLEEGLRVTHHDRSSNAPIRFLRGDALAVPFADASVDVVTSTMFLHHLSDADTTAALAEMRRVARHAVVVADLIRSRRAYAWITLFTLAATPMVKHDARASVAHAFTLDEMRLRAAEAGMPDASVTRTFAHRSMLVWRRDG